MTVRVFIYFCYYWKTIHYYKNNLPSTFYIEVIFFMTFVFYTFTNSNNRNNME